MLLQSRDSFGPMNSEIPLASITYIPAESAKCAHNIIPELLALYSSCIFCKENLLVRFWGRQGYKGSRCDSVSCAGFYQRGSFKHLPRIQGFWNSCSKISCLQNCTQQQKWKLRMGQSFVSSCWMWWQTRWCLWGQNRLPSFRSLFWKETLLRLKMMTWVRTQIT